MNREDMVDTEPPPVPVEETADDAKRRRRHLVTACQLLGLALLALGIALPHLIEAESPTPMPYRWPAHHALYLHTGGDPAQCRVDDGVTEAFTVSIPASPSGSFQVAGKRLGVLASAATVTCAGSVTANLDPDVRYAIAGSPATEALAGMGLVIAIFTTHLRNGMRVAKVI